MIAVSTPGGGGFGNPFLRAPELVARDVAKGYYTRQQAEAWFGVVLTGGGGVDRAATEAARGGTAAQQT